MKKNQNIYTIYFLSSVDKKDIFYIGSTSQPLKTRLCGHVSTNSSNKSKMERIKKHNYKISIHKIKDVCGLRAALAAESECITVFRKNGHNLCNSQNPIRAKKNDQINTSSILVSKSVVELVRKNKRETHIPIGIFFELAAKEKLEKEKSKP